MIGWEKKKFATNFYTWETHVSTRNETVGEWYTFTGIYYYYPSNIL